MSTSGGLRRSRLIVGACLVVAATALFVVGGSGYSSAGAVALAVLGLISIAISRRR